MKKLLYRHRTLSTCLVVCLASGCTAPPPYDRAFIADELTTRTGASIAPEGMPADFEWAPAVALDDGLSAEEAAATALWNNADFEQRLAELGWAKADLVAASTFPNPSLTLDFPEGPQVFDALLALPVDLLARNSRIDRSRAELDRVLATVQESALELVREARIAHAELALAQERIELMNQFSTLMAEMAEIATARQEVGRTSVRIATQAQADAADVAGQALQATASAQIAANRLAQLIGFPGDAGALQLQSPNFTTPVLPPAESLLAEALSSRPELRAAEAAMVAAGAEAGFERARILELVARVTAVETEGSDTTLDPGVQIGLPIFNQNQGGRLRAQASMQRALAGYVAAERLIRRQVSDALAAFVAADRSYSLWRDEVVPGRQLEADLTQDAYDLGQVSYFDWTLSQTNYVRAQLALADSALALHKAYADLERGIGQRIQSEATGR